ncbi:MAG TPA: hypothetical protein VFU82_00640 [Gammaproteobacteria bacterium]|nr:hypothetical protein [Gammaproteobacteria bacterium]
MKRLLLHPGSLRLPPSQIKRKAFDLGYNTANHQRSDVARDEASFASSGVFAFTTIPDQTKGV